MTEVETLKRADLLNIWRGIDAIEFAFIKRLDPNKPLPHGNLDSDWLEALWRKYVTKDKDK